MLRNSPDPSTNITQFIDLKDNKKYYSDTEIQSYFIKCKNILDNVKLKWVGVKEEETETINSNKILVYNENIHFYEYNYQNYLIGIEGNKQVPYQYCLINANNCHRRCIGRLGKKIFGFVSTNLYKPYKTSLYNHYSIYFQDLMKSSLGYYVKDFGYNDQYTTYMEHNPFYAVISMLINCIGIDNFYYPEKCHCCCGMKCIQKFKELQLLHNDKVIFRMELIKKIKNQDDFFLSKVSNIFKCYYYEYEHLLTTFNILYYKNCFEMNKLPNPENPSETIGVGEWEIPNQPLGTQIFYNLVINTL